MTYSQLSTYELAEALVTRLSDSGLTIAAAESLTGGLVCSALVDVPGASAVLRGSVTAYATELKAQVLGVDDARLASVGPVDAQVAQEMADGVAQPWLLPVWQGQAQLTAMRRVPSILPPLPLGGVCGACCSWRGSARRYVLKQFATCWY